MCGILGGTGEFSNQLVEFDLQLLYRRGPDNQKLLRVNKDLTMAATRLAMTDPHPRSNQPMCDVSTGNTIVFNGEIYNFKLLRNDLKQRGFKFTTDSDTEVLLKGLSFYGEEMIEKLEGMFAFAYFDKKSNSLLIARDYLGKKPLYYSVKDSNIIFCSQANLIKKYVKGINIDYLSIQNYFNFGFLIDPNSMYEQIAAVRPGEYLKFEISDGSLLKQNNFIPYSIQHPEPSNIRDQIQKSLYERIDGHQNNLALSLSGGIDSTILAIECSRLGIPVKTYSMSYPDSDKERYNIDSNNASVIAKKLKLDFNVVAMPDSQEIPLILSDFIKLMGEPSNNPTGLAMTHLYSQISERGHRLVITGDGSDEIFGGYPRYRLAHRIRKFPQFYRLDSYELTKRLTLKSNYLVKYLLPFESWNSNNLWKYFHQTMSEGDLKFLNNKFQFTNTKFFGDELHDYFDHSFNRVAATLFKDLRTWLPMESNRKLDRISMWNSIEARSPFQAETIIGSGLKLMNKSNFHNLDKYYLYESYPELQDLPISKVKSGFISPVGHWLRSNSELQYEALAGINSFLPLNKEFLKELHNAPKELNFRYTKMLWSIIVLYNWFLNE
jgi:asparagine synthase (glutamine-hydrolysing)